MSEPVLKAHQSWLPQAPGSYAERRERLFRIGDVAHHMRESTSTLRYWEEEFAEWLHFVVRSKKSDQRVYSPRMRETLGEIQRLLRIELYTIAGAKRQLRLAAERAKAAGFHV